MNKKLDFREKTVCNIVGKMFALASREINCYEISFCEAWLNSTLCSRISHMDETLICQSPTYLLNSLRNESELLTHKDYKMQEDTMYWVGYIFTFWMLLKDITGKEIVERYDIKSILQQYDILHTQSSRFAIEEIQENYSKAQILKNKLLSD